MALGTGSIYNCQDTATTANVNGGGFNPNNANFPTNLTTDSNTANTASPVVSSATYNFAAGDVGAWLFVKTGTNWTPGFYPIVSVASNKATLNAAIGAAVQLNPITSVYDTPNTVVGCATVGTPTNGTFGVNYSMLDTAYFTAANFGAVGASTTLTSATGTFTVVSVGNFYHQTTTGTGGFGVVGWYEIVSFTNATTVVLDRTPNSGTASVNCTGFVGGAARLNGLEDAFLEAVPAQGVVWIKTGTYNISGTINIASTNGTAAFPVNIIGYKTVWGDACYTTDRPTLNAAANAVTMGVAQNLINLTLTSTTAAGFTTGANASVFNCKVTNTSTTAGRTAITLGSDSVIIMCEAISQNGAAITNGTRTKTYGNYCRDSSTGVSSAGILPVSIGNVIANCNTGLSAGAANAAGIIVNNTFYGSETPRGVGLDFTNAASSSNRVIGNIIYGFATGIQVSTAEQRSNLSLNNTFFNNTTDTTLWSKSPFDIAVNPGFVGATQITGSTATTSGSVLTQSGGAFGTVADNEDYLHVISGTGVTVGIYLITSHTTTTLTVNNALGTSSAGDVVYYVTTGHNFSVGTALAARGFPNWMNMGMEAISYPYIGAYQPSNANYYMTIL